MSSCRVRATFVEHRVHVLRHRHDVRGAHRLLLRRAQLRRLADPIVHRGEEVVGAALGQTHQAEEDHRRVLPRELEVQVTPTARDEALDELDAPRPDHRLERLDDLRREQRREQLAVLGVLRRVELLGDHPAHRVGLGGVDRASGPGTRAGRSGSRRARDRATPRARRRTASASTRPSRWRPGSPRRRGTPRAADPTWSTGRRRGRDRRRRSTIPGRRSSPESNWHTVPKLRNGPAADSEEVRQVSAACRCPSRSNASSSRASGGPGRRRGRASREHVPDDRRERRREDTDLLVVVGTEPEAHPHHLVEVGESTSSRRGSPTRGLGAVAHDGAPTLVGLAFERRRWRWRRRGSRASRGTTRGTRREGSHRRGEPAARGTCGATRAPAPR